MIEDTEDKLYRKLCQKPFNPHYVSKLISKVTDALQGPNTMKVAWTDQHIELFEQCSLAETGWSYEETIAAVKDYVDSKEGSQEIVDPSYVLFWVRTRPLHRREER